MDAQISNKKIELIQWLSTLEDKSIIEKLLQLKKEESKDWWNSISDEEKSSIEKGIAEANDDNVKPHTIAQKIYEKWL